MAELVELGLILVNECGECRANRCGDTSGSRDDTVDSQRCVLDC